MFEKKFTQEDLGNIIGVNRQMISRWLTTDRNPSLASIKKLAAALNVPVTYFIEDEEQNINNEKTDEQKNISIKTITELIKKEIKKYEPEINLLKREIKVLKEKNKSLEIKVSKLK